jgi:hypothetical protein
LRLPSDGVVSVVVAEIGQAVRAEQVAIEETGKQWMTFNVREDFLRGLALETTIDVVRQGASEAVPAVVTEILPLGRSRPGKLSARSAITIAICCACTSIRTASRAGSSPAWRCGSIAERRVGARPQTSQVSAWMHQL